MKFLMRDLCITDLHLAHLQINQAIISGSLNRRKQFHPKVRQVCERRRCARRDRGRDGGAGERPEVAEHGRDLAL